jgi:chromosome segregation ATPase
MVRRIRRKHQPPAYPTELGEAVMDPLGFSARREEHEEKLVALEQRHHEVAREKAKARHAVRQAEKAMAEARKAKAKNEEFMSLFANLRKELDELRHDKQKTKDQPQTTKSEIDKALSEFSRNIAADE